MADRPLHLRPLLWIASSRKDFGDFPPKVQDEFGFGLHLAQTGLMPPAAKILKGIGGGIVELIDDFDGDTYRAVYTVRFDTAIYALHCFKKKSKSGIKTPQMDIDLIKKRYRDAEAHHAQQQIERKKK